MNANLFKGEMKKLGYRQADVAEKIGISLSRFNAKINGTQGAEFSLAEIRAIKSLFGFSAEQVDIIFFDTKVS